MSIRESRIKYFLYAKDTLHFHGITWMFLSIKREYVFYEPAGSFSYCDSPVGSENSKSDNK